MSSSLVGGVWPLLSMYIANTLTSIFAMNNFTAQIPSATASAAVIIGSPRFVSVNPKMFTRSLVNAAVLDYNEYVPEGKERS